MGSLGLSEAVANDFVNAPDALAAAPSALPVDAIEPARDQPRRNIDQRDLEDLAGSIKANGLINPITVEPAGEPGRWRIIAGERRWRAAKLAGLETVSATVLRGLTDQQRAEVQLVENLQREDLSPVEEARALDSLIREHGLTQEEAGQRIGKPQTRISRALTLLKLPDDLLDYATLHKDLPFSLLYAIATADDEGLMRGMFERAKLGRLSVRQADEMKKAWEAKLAGDPPGPRRIAAEKFGWSGGGKTKITFPPGCDSVEKKIAALEEALVDLQSGGETA